MKTLNEGKWNLIEITNENILEILGGNIFYAYYALIWRSTNLKFGKSY